MKLVLADMLDDLREKHLWPVAVALIAVLVAVPLVLAKPAKQPSPSSTPSTGSATLPDAAADVLAAKDTTGAGSGLGVFDSRNPFRPPGTVLKSKDATAAGAPASTTTAGPTSESSGSLAVPSGSSGLESGGTGVAVPPTETAPPTTASPSPRYTYVIDVTFTRDEHKRTLKSMQPLDMLPNEASPLFIFLGVDAHASNARFLVDATLEGAGEGRCKPNAAGCAVLSLGAGSVHQFTNDQGVSYRLRVDQIRRVKVPVAPAASASVNATPKITLVAPMRLSIGPEVTIRGEGFSSRRSRNTVIFRAPTGRVAFAKPMRASPTKLVLGVPDVVSGLMSSSDGKPVATRFKLRVLSYRFGKYTVKRLSPVILPFGYVSPAGSAG
jgi:hypothetical protein